MNIARATSNKKTRLNATESWVGKKKDKGEHDEVLREGQLEDDGKKGTRW